MLFLLIILFVLFYGYRFLAWLNGDFQSFSHEPEDEEDED